MTALLLRMFKGSSTVLYIGKIQIKFHPSSKKSLVLCPNKALKKKSISLLLLIQTLMDKQTLVPS